MKEIRAVITLTHSDSVSGTTIFDDGTKAFWTEGRSAWTVLLRPDGRWEEAAAGDTPMHPILELMLDDDRHEQAYGSGFEGGQGGREMTEVEELEWFIARNLMRTWDQTWRDR